MIYGENKNTHSTCGDESEHAFLKLIRADIFRRIADDVACGAGHRACALELAISTKYLMIVLGQSHIDERRIAKVARQSPGKRVESTDLTS